MIDHWVPRFLKGKLQIRGRLIFPLLRLIPRFRLQEKRRAETEFWVKTFDKRFREGRFWMDDVESLLREYGEWGRLTTSKPLDYWTLRWLEGRALCLRVLKESKIDDTKFYVGKTLVDIGPGPQGLLETSDAKVKIGVEPLAEEFRRQGLLIPSADTIYLPVPAEAIPLLSGTVDLVVVRNSLDHVERPVQVVREVYRILVPGGYLLLNVDLEHNPTIWEPHTFSLNGIHDLLSSFETIHEAIHAKGQRQNMPVLIGMYKKPLHEDSQ